MSGCILHLSISHSPVFLLNSCLDLFSAPHLRGDPFSRSYGVNLPSSLTVNLSSALVYSTRPPVSVYGTGPEVFITLSGFSREYGYHRCRLARGLAVLSRFTTPGGFASPAYSYTVQRAIPSARGCVTAPSPHHLTAGATESLPFVHRGRLAAFT